METILLLVVALSLIALCVAIYFFKGKPAPVVEIPPVQLTEPVLVQKQDGKSFKKLKQIAKKSSKNCPGPDPNHPAFKFCLKHNAIDFDFVELEQQERCVVVGESDTIFVYKVNEQGRVISTFMKMEEGKNLVSVSIARPQNSPNKFVVAVACFDHSQLLVFPLVQTEQTLKFGPMQAQIMNAHDYPVGRARLSKVQAKLMVTCGEGVDLQFKLWNLQTQKCEHQLKTGQIRHKQMVQSQENDYFAVAAGTSEVRIYHIAQTARAGLNLEKITTLTAHHQEAIAVALSREFCVTISKDLTLAIHKIEQYSSKLLAQKSFDLDEHSKVAIVAAEDGSQLVAVTLQSFEILVLNHKLEQKMSIPSPHNGQPVNELRFTSPSQLVSSSRLDQRINFWTI